MSKAKTDKLKPLECPFCGGKPTVEEWKYIDHIDGIDPTSWRIGCNKRKCPSEPSVIRLLKVEAIKAWNTRPKAKSKVPEEKATPKRYP